MRNVIDAALSPFRGFNMAVVYENHSQIIDGVIFFSLFLGLSKFAFAKRFTGRPANAISIAFSFALTIALLVAERKFGFSIKSFGVFAIGVVLLVTGFFMVTLSRTAGLNPVTAFSFTYCLLYLSVASIVPNLFDFIATRAPWLNGLLGIVFLVSLFKSTQSIFKYMFSKNKPGKGGLNGFAGTPEVSSEINLEDNEIRAIKNLRQRIATVNDIYDALSQIEKTIKHNPNLTAEQLDFIHRCISEISTKEAIFIRNHNELTRQLKLLGRIDAERLERLQAELLTAPENTRRIKEAEIDIEKRKIEYDQKIIEAKTQIDAQIRSFNEQTTLAAGKIRTDPASSLPGLANAKGALIQIKKLIEMMKGLSRELQDLHKTQKELLKGERRKRK